MTRWRLYPSALELYLATAIQLRTVWSWNREDCLKAVTSMQNSSTFSPNPAYFFNLSDPNNPILTLEGCYALCDSKMGFYPDTGPRLIDWFLPIILLIANMQFTTDIGMERFLMIVHLLGDPIHSTLSLLCEVEDWRCCVSDVKKWLQRHDLEQHRKDRTENLAIIVAVAEEFIKPFSINDMLSSFTGTEKEFDVILQDTADTLRNSRANEILRTFFAVILYILQVIAVFVPAVGSASSPSGGRIGPAMLLSWLLPIVLLSNLVGDMSSWRNCARIISHFLKHIGNQRDRQFFCAPQTSHLRSYKEEQTPFFNSLAWSGGIHTYRPSKHVLGWKNFILAVLSFLPVTLAFGIAFAVLDTAPSYFSCRHLLVISVYVFWLISVLLTFALSSFKGKFSASGKYLWHIILVKDALIGTPILALTIASSCGMWNSCYCWSGALVLSSSATVPLNPTSAFNLNDHVVYPATVSAGLFLQICVFALMVCVGWRGFRVMWGKSKREGEESGMGEGVEERPRMMMVDGDAAGKRDETEGGGGVEARPQAMVVDGSAVGTLEGVDADAGPDEQMKVRIEFMADVEQLDGKEPDMAARELTGSEEGEKGENVSD